MLCPWCESGEVNMKTVVIFGGTGFIGTHLSQFLLRDAAIQEIVLADLNPPSAEKYTATLQDALVSGRARYLNCDVRQPLTLDGLPHADVIFNLAAVHREPGHLAAEYYATNLLGAEHVCAYAATIGCARLVFTSSISPYGSAESRKDEASIPVPDTPYGGSKLVAEKIHMAWQAAAAGRQLLIVRPGVVFGAGEAGNVTRLIRSLIRGYFLYMGNRTTRKAGGYVKELCRVISFGLEHQDRTGESLALLNFSMDPPPAIEDFVKAINKTANVRRRSWSVYRPLLLGAAYPIDTMARLFGIQQPISPIRVRKLCRSTNVDPKRLREIGYVYHYSLEQAFQDWKLDKPEDFGP
jgi:nucleoside-diphosphate-sugar epimerase